MSGTLKVKVDNVDAVMRSITALTKQRVLIGIPATNAGRKEGPIDNASIGYVHEFGSPKQNIPPRPFLVPGVRDSHQRVIGNLRRALVLSCARLPDQAEKQLHIAGMAAASSVKMKMRQGPFIPLSDVTLWARVNRNTTKGYAGSRKGAALELAARAQGAAPSTDFAKPLIDTAQLLKAVTYVIRRK